MEALFLGTGGGRMCSIKQMRRTGGVYFDLDSLKLLVDPGPGALVHALSQKVPLNKLNLLLVTHAHIDHCNDAEVIIEAITSGATNKKGTLITNTTVLHGLKEKDYNFAQKIDNYHLKSLEKVIEIHNEEIKKFGDYEFSFIKSKHGDPNTLSFKIKKTGFSLGYIADTIYFDGLIDFFKDCKILFINVLRPKNNPWKGHLSTQDVLTIINKIKPEKVVLHHFGLAMLYGSIKREEWWLKKNLKNSCEVVFAKDFQRVKLTPHKSKENSLRKFLNSS